MRCPRCGNDHGSPSEGDYLHDGRRLVEVVAISPQGTSALLRDCKSPAGAPGPEDEFSLGVCVLVKAFVPVRQKVAA